MLIFTSRPNILLFHQHVGWAASQGLGGHVVGGDYPAPVWDRKTGKSQGKWQWCHVLAKRQLNVRLAEHCPNWRVGWTSLADSVSVGFQDEDEKDLMKAKAIHTNDSTPFLAYVSAENVQMALK